MTEATAPAPAPGPTAADDAIALLNVKCVNAIEVLYETVEQHLCRIDESLHLALESVRKHQAVVDAMELQRTRVLQIRYQLQVAKEAAEDCERKCTRISFE